MLKKLMFVPLLCTCIAHADSSNDNETIIPDGKIIDYPSIYHDVTPSAGPRVINGYGVFLTADYIYWTARQDNMQYASTGYTNNNNVSTSPGSTGDLNYTFRTGFKSGIGFSFEHDSWDLAFNYTWYQSNHNKGSISGDQRAGLTPNFIPALTLTADDYFSNASSSWKLHFNVIDGELGRNFFISKFLSLRPYIGLKGSWQNQHNNTTYSGYIDSNPFNYLRNLKSSFLGMGIRTGCDMGWHIAGTWSLFGNVAISALWGQFKAKRNDTAELYNATRSPISASAHLHTATPVLELALGIRKDQWFLNNRFHVGVQAGWEEQIWFNQNPTLGNSGAVSSGDLVLQGLSVRLRFDF